MDIKEKNTFKFWRTKSHDATIRQMIYVKNLLSRSEDAVKYLKMVIRKNTDINTYNTILRDLDKWIQKK